MTFILPGTLFGLPNGSWGLLGYGVNKGFDGKLYFFLEKIPLNKAMEKNYQILVFRKKYLKLKVEIFPFLFFRHNLII